MSTQQHNKTCQNYFFVLLGISVFTLLSFSSRLLPPNYLPFSSSFFRLGNRLFFRYEDQFADFFKWLSAFQPLNAHYWHFTLFSAQTEALISTYLSSNPYTQQPVALYSLHGLPPLTVLTAAITSRLLNIGPPEYIFLVISLCLAVLPVLIIWKLFLQSTNIKLLSFLTLLYMGSYPYLFSIDRGNLGALAYNTIATIAILILLFFAKRFIRVPILCQFL